MRDPFARHPVDAAIDDFRIEMFRKRQDRIARFGEAYVTAEDNSIAAQAKLSNARARLKADQRLGNPVWIAEDEARVAKAEAEYEQAAAAFVRVRHGIGVVS